MALVALLLLAGPAAPNPHEETVIKEGVKFEDLDGDGHRDGGEPGLPGWKINAYADTDGDGVLSLAEFNAGAAGTATTGANGFYAIDGLAPGKYIFCEELPLDAEWIQSFPAANNKCAAGAGLGPHGYAHDMPAGKVCSCNDFGNFKKAKKSGIKFLDVEGNGVFDNDDEPIVGWKIFLLDEDGNAVAETTTGSGGSYSFEVDPGTYFVCEEVQDGFTQTAPATYVQECVDAGHGAYGWAVMLTSGEEDEDNDFGNKPKEEEKGSKSGVKYEDLNGNHTRDTGEPGLPNWEIRAYVDSNGDGTLQATETTIADSDTTDGTGAYVLALDPGTYVVCEVLQAGYGQTEPDPTTNQKCAAIPGLGPAGYAITVTLPFNETGNDFGNRKPVCPEDQNRAASITRTVRDTANDIPDSQAPDYATLQAAYNAAQASGNPNEVIGFFQPTSENIVLNQAKALTITECRNAQVTAANDGLAVWYIGPSAGHLLIIGPTAHEGTIGWHIDDGANGHELKGLRAHGASQYGILVEGDSNDVGFNSVDTSAVGIRIEVGADNNDVHGSTVEKNTGDGVQVAGNNNTFSDAKVGRDFGNGGDGVEVSGNGNTIEKVDADRNTLNGILVTGNGNTIFDNAAASDNNRGNGQDGIKVTGANNTIDNNIANDNAGDGFDISGGTSSALANKLEENESNQTTNTTGTKENAGVEYRLLNWIANTAPPDNKADTVVVPSSTKCTSSFPAAGTTVNISVEQTCE
jgi:SdrD B-like protein/parallel beta helix pectate lyase-like protein